MLFIPWYDQNPCGMLNLKGSRLVYASAFLSSLGFALIGYGNGLLGGIINEEPFKRKFNYPNSSEIGFITAIYGIGAFFGSVSTAILGDGLGRRKSIAFGAVIMIVGSLVQGSAKSIHSLSVGRFTAGIGIGFLNSTIPVLQAELSPHGRRGMFVAISCTTLNIGILLAYWIDFSLYDLNSNRSWQIPIFFQIILLAPIIILSILVCESPRWLLSQDEDTSAQLILANLHNSFPEDPEVQAEFDALKETVLLDQVDHERSSFWKDFFNRDDLTSSKRLWMSLGIQIFQQLGGINILIYYSSILFADSIKLSPRNSSQMSVLLQIWLVLMSTITWGLIDRAGRKPLILIGIFGQALSMMLQGLFIYKLDSEDNVGTINKLSFWAILAILMLFLFETSFTIGMQATVWAYCSEILSLRLRSRGTSLATSVNWACSSILIQLAPIVLEKIGYVSFLILSVINLSFLPIVYFYFKETKGLSLEEIDQLFVTS